MKPLSEYIKRLAAEVHKDTNFAYWKERIEKKYGLTPLIGPGVDNPFWILREIDSIFSPVPERLIRACGLNTLVLRADMGPNRPYYPNHGYFVDNRVVLNADIFCHPDQPDDFFDFHGYFLTRPQQTLLHEIGHAYDAHNGDLSLKDNWLELSGWNREKAPGLERLVIRDPGAPEVIGEWYFNPKAEFTRFYAKRNPWDDFADSFSFYVAGMKNKVPPKKCAYFDDLLKKYY
jgi:hypothetical protein